MWMTRYLVPIGTVVIAVSLFIGLFLLINLSDTREEHPTTRPGCILVIEEDWRWDVIGEPYDTKMFEVCTETTETVTPVG